MTSGSGGPPTSTGSGSGGGPGPVGPDLGAGTVNARRLTLTEYNNTVRDLLGDNSAPFNIGIVSDTYGPSTFEEGGSIGDQQAGPLLDISMKLASTAVGNMQALLPGTPVPTAAADQDAWAHTFITTFGRKAFRRPLLQAESDGLFALYQAQLAAPISGTFSDGIAATISAMLMSPSFLYRWELGPNKPIVQGSLVAFNQYEIASRLSYMIWASMPDDALSAAADQNQLTTSDQIKGQAQRMLQDPKAKAGLAEFHMQWLKLTDLPTLNKDAMAFTPALTTSMLGETREFVWSVLGPQGDGKLDTLLTSSKTFVDSNLASLIYGLPNITGTAFTPVTLDPTQRAGLLTQASFLASRSNPDYNNPINTGVAMLRRLFCTDIQKPTNLVVTPISGPAPGSTIRQTYDIHGQKACAASCHSIIDPMGFAFLNYDAMGIWTNQDQGQPVNAAGSFTVGGNTTTFKNAVDLMQQLTKDQQVTDCVSTMWLQYLNRRPVDANKGDDGSLAAARTAQSAHSNDIREMLYALTNTNAFTVRLPNVGENIQ